MTTPSPSLSDQLDALLDSATGSTTRIALAPTPGAQTLSLVRERLRRELAALISKRPARDEVLYDARARLAGLNADYRMGRRDLKPELDAAQADFDKAAARSYRLDEAIGFMRERMERVGM